MADPAADASTAPAARRPRARSFGPTVLAGLAGGVLAAVAGSRAWAEADGSGADSAIEGIAMASAASSDASAPPVTALALVVLATWGVVLVSRGRARRVMTWLGVLAALGATGFAVAAWVVAPDAVAEAFSPYGLADLQVSRTAWSWAGVAGGLVALAAAVLATRVVRSWPEMGRRYDAPAGAAGAAAAPGAAGAGAAPGPAGESPDEASSLDLWKAIDEGRDPTDRGAP